METESYPSALYVLFIFYLLNNSFQSSLEHDYFTFNNSF